MTRTQRPPKRSTTPTSATGSTESLPPPSPSAPSATASGGVTGTGGVQKPLYLCTPFVDSALVVGNFKTIVMQPKHVDVLEWVAANSESDSLSWTWIQSKL